MIYCIEFERESEGKDVIHHISDTKPTNDEAIQIIKDLGYIFNVGYDEIEAIYEVSE